MSLSRPPRFPPPSLGARRTVVDRFTTTRPLSVSQYAALIGRALRTVGPATLEGEVQRPRYTAKGMLWFTLTDGDAALSCKVFRTELRRLEHRPKEGDLVVVEVDRPDLYPPAGKLDLIVTAIRLAGEGELLRRRQELIERLTAEGLCDRDRWRPLPRFPCGVGVIAGRESDALADVVRALQDRWPAVNIFVRPALVQGVEAPRELIAAIAQLDSDPRVDVIIIARGGGSVQDLSCFDDERLCRAIFASRKPIVCAVGHTENNPVCNHVTWSAFTPSRSAELVVPSRVEVSQEIGFVGAKLAAAHRRLAALREEVERYRARRSATALLDHRSELVQTAGAPVRRAAARIDRIVEGLSSEGQRVSRAAKRQLEDHRRDYSRALARLQGEIERPTKRRLESQKWDLQEVGRAIKRVVRTAYARWQREVAHTGQLVHAHDHRGRGWALLHRGQERITTAEALTVGLQFEVTLHDGAATAEVTAQKPTTQQRKEKGDG